MAKDRPRDVSIVLALVAAGVALRVTGLDIHSLWADEGETVATALAPDLALAMKGVRHPPIPFLVFRDWIPLLGEYDASLRLLPALLSSVSLVLFAGLARVWLTGPARLLAVALYAGSSFLIWHGQEVRGYAFVELAALAALLGAARVLDRRRASGWSLLLVFLGTALALGSHYLGGLVFAAIAVLAGAGVGLHRLSRRTGLALAAASAAGLLVWLPWLVAMVPVQMAAPFGYQSHLGWRSFAELPVRHLVCELAVLPASWSPGIYALGALALLGFVAHVVRLGWRAARRNAARPEDLWILIAFAAPVGGALLLMLVMPANFTPKYLIAAAPGSVLMIASGLAAPGRRSVVVVVGVTVVLGVLAVTVYQKTDNFREDFRSACRELVERWRDGDRVLVVTGTPDAFNDATVAHYLRVQGRPDILESMRRASAYFDGPVVPEVGRRLHVIYRSAPYARPYLRRIEASHRELHRGPKRFRVRYLLFTAPGKAGAR